MKRFSSFKAAFAIFDFAKANPKFSFKFIVIFSLSILFYVAAILSSGYFKIIIEMFNSIDSPESMSVNKNLFDASNRMNLISIIVSISYIPLITMGLRKTIRNEEIGFYGFKWGKDENRLCVAFLVFIGVLMGVYIAIILLGIIAFGMIFALKSVPLFATIIGAVFGIGAVFAIYGIMIRLSQFGVITIAQRKVGTIDSYKDTKGYGWSFFWAYFINYLSFFIGYALVVLAGFIAYKLSGNFPIDIASLINPIWLIFCLFAGFVFGTFFLSQLCIGSYAYLIMHEGEELPQETISENVWKN